MKANQRKKTEEDSKLDLSQMNRDADDAPKRNLNGSLEQVKEELRDAYMVYKELRERCTLDINPANKTDKPVYYFKPDTFMMDDQESQRFFRESLLRKISAMPKPEPIMYLGDEMHKIFQATVADQSRPTICKRNLAMFYKRRHYALQHLKYKVLQRWAHLAMNSSQLDTGKDAVFLYGKIEYSIEQAMNRAERLEQPDFFDEAIPKNRPQTKAELGEGSLYVENLDLKPQSLLREDDVEIYIRSVAYRNKVSKVVNKFMSRLKWLPMLNRYEIFAKALESRQAQKNRNIEQQREFIVEIDKRAREYHIVTSDMEAELNEILNTHYARQHALMYTSESEKVTNSWRSDHDNVPNLINNQHELKLRIMGEAKLFDIDADIEIDHGYSYSYRVTVRFPSVFQRQCIKSQFSMYDVFARDSDKNQVQKHTLSNMTRVDTNIFRDISTTPNMVPDDDSLAYEMRNDDIKVIRLKSSAYWIDYVCMTPFEPDWHRKQQALLNNGNPIDSLTRSGMNFLDSSDLASVNRINEDNALLHQQTIKKLQALNPHNMVIQRTLNSNDGEKKFAVNLQDHMNSINEAAQMDKHLMNAVQGGGVASEIGNGRDTTLRLAEKQAQMSRSGLRTTPHHLLVSFYTLRYMKSRENKTKILYALNFCRAVQKRLCLDLREFGTRERVDSHLNQPYIHSTDADKKVVTNVNLSKSPYDGMVDESSRQAKDAKLRAEEEEKYEKMTVFDPDVIANMKNMASVRMYKQNGTFNNKVFSTCPAVPKFHCTFGEPTMRQTEDIEMDLKKNQGGISKQSLKLMGRVDHTEIDERLQEVYVRDDFGVYIIYDCVLQDMKGMEEELIKICSYFLNKSEVLQDVHTEKPLPAKDRLQVLSDLLECEAKFQFKKVKLCLAYLECYEHIVDPLEQQRLMQVITDEMARRPRLNMQANYFQDSYAAEFQCLDNQFELIKVITKNQISLERVSNRMLQDSLSLSYTLCNQYETNRFKYQDAEDLLEAVIKKERNEKAARRYARVMRAHNARRKNDHKTTAGIQPAGEEIVAEADDKEEVSGSESGSAKGKKQPSDGDKASNADKKTKDEDVDDLGEPSINSDMSEMDILNRQENVFQTLLGLPEISIETLYMAFREKDKTILNVMREQTNFIQIHEGYPEFLNIQQGGTNGDAMRTFQATPWSEKIAHMDFYDSLIFVNKLAAITGQVQQELYDVLKPFDPTMMTYIDAHVAEFALKEFQRVLKIQEGAETEYEGRQYVEDESVLGNADKVIFYAKEMLSQLTMAPKERLDPYLVAKLNKKSIEFFNFPRMSKSQNKYTMQFKDGVQPAEWVIMMHRQQIVDTAKRKGAEKTINIEHVFANAQMGLSSNRNIDVPSMLQTYCNIVELMRLRHEIILAASECSVLEQIYHNQAAACKIKGINARLGESISFDTVDVNDEATDLINYFDDGPSHSTSINLAVREFDKALLSNFNFRNPDSLTLNITDAGLEEVRAILMYQLLQKNLLIVATRINQLLIDSSQKAITELDILHKFNVVCPNSTFDVNAIFSRNADNVSNTLIKEQRLKFGQNMSSAVAAIFYDVSSAKRQMRTDVQKEFSNYMSKVTKEKPFIRNELVQRIMRSFKVKQLVRYCEQIMLQTLLDAQKVQAVQVCQRLRVISQYFTFNPARFDMTVIQRGKPGEPRKEDYQIFKYETNKMLENFTYPYMPPEEKEDELEDHTESRDIRVLNANSMTIIDLEGIPSSAQLLRCEASSIDELKIYRQRLAKVHLNYNKNWCEDLRNLDTEVDNPEFQTKAMLPTMTPKDTDPSQGKGKPENTEIDEQGYPFLDYEEALYFGQSKFAVMIRYYQYLERILSLEWFICKLQFKHDVAVHIDDAFTLGLPFWVDTDYEKRMKREVTIRTVQPEHNIIAQNFLHSNIVSRQSKKYIAEEISNVSLTMQNLIRKYRDTKEELKYEYLNSYTEFRYMQILGSFHKIIQQFYIQKRGGNGICSLREAISQLAKIDHVRTSFTRGNSFHVNTSLVYSQMQLLENTNMIYGAHSEDEYQNFMRCVQPIINEKALEPPQLTLFQSLYQTDSYRKRLPTQFSGQLVSTHNANSFKSLDTALLNMSYDNRQYAQSFIMQAKDQANDYMEMTYDPNLANMASDQVYSIIDLEAAKKYLADGTQALLLKNALICWNENQILPDDPALYARFEEHFRNSFFWKIIEHKENMIAAKESRPNANDNMPTKAELNELKQQIEDLQANYSLATATEEEHRDRMIQTLKKEFRMQKKKVTLDQFYTTKAEIQVLSNEIEKHITRASVQALDAECVALTKCFNLSQPKIQMRIHPFQQFAATLYDQVDPNKHLDMSEKLGFVQEFLTQLQNRSTMVETLTSGPGVVFTKKDINDAIQRFCRQIITYGEKELMSRSDLFCQKEEQYLHLIYVKDQKISELERRIKNQAKNIENIISAKLFEKGNQLIYQLDSTSRLLTFFKQTMFGLENEIRNKIIGQQAQKFKLQKDELDTQKEKLKDYMKEVENVVSVIIQKDYDLIQQDLKKMVEKSWNTDLELTNYVPPTLYPGTGDFRYRNPIQQIIVRNERSSVADERSSGGYGAGAGAGAGIGTGYGRGQTVASTSDVVIKDLALESVGTLPGSVVPEGFKHYSHCTCFRPNKKYPNYDMEHAELEMYSEMEARSELKRVCFVMRKQRLFWRFKEMVSKQKFQNKINLMKKQLSNNAYLWDQMAESEKRETILKQELLFTQQSLSASEKVIEKLQEEMKKVEADRQRLIKYKHSKAERLKELEDKIKKFEVYENIDTDKLINVLGKKDEECRALSSIADNFTHQLSLVEHQKHREVGVYKNKLVHEQVKTQQIVEKMEQMKLELKMLESNDTSVAAIWKKKCLDLFEVCQTLKQENEELRDRCKELIVQGMQLADAVTQEHEQQNRFIMQQQPVIYSAGPPTQTGGNNISLPKLQKNTSVQRVNQQSSAFASSKQAPATAEPMSGRAGATTANTYEINSNLAGYFDNRMDNYGIVSQQSTKPFEELTHPGESALGHKMQSQYSRTNAEPQLGKSYDGRFASTMQSKIAAKQGPFGQPPNPAVNALRSPQLQHINNRGGNMRGNNRTTFPQTQQQRRGSKAVGGGAGAGAGAGPSGPTYYMPSQNDRSSQQSRKNQNARSILNSGGVVTNQKDQLGESSFNQSFQATGNSDKFASANRSQINSQQTGINNRMNYLQKSPQTALEARGFRQQQNTTGLMNYNSNLPPGGGHHNDSLFESSKASTSAPGQFARRQFAKNAAAITSNQPGGARGMIVTQNQRQTDMMGTAVLGSKMLTSKQQVPVSTNPSSNMKIQSTKPGSQTTEMPSSTGQVTSKPPNSVIAANNQPISQQPLQEASFAAVVEDSSPPTRAQASNGSINNIKIGELLNTEMTLNKLVSEDGGATMGEDDHS